MTGVPDTAAAVRIRWVLLAATLVSGLALLAAQATGYAGTVAVTLALALVVAWGWPRITGSATPSATSGVLAVAAVAIVLSARDAGLRWLPAAVAFGLVLAFFGQLVRRSGREGLVLTLLSSFGGLAVTASGATAVVAAQSDRGRAVAVVALAAVVAAVLGDLLAAAPALRARPGAVGAVGLVGTAVVASVVAAVVSTRFDEVGPGTALAIGAAVGVVSWALRRVLALEPELPTLRGQLAAGAASVLAVGAVINLATALT
ncbi:hypothetical protein GCM10023258_09520 [Terrabacter aeriphilus]|uniref:Uncharacterized protein n=1 Tax=Terrabacter aeriphilus TaxID=515662 RepID=A0ABP9J5A6_9MICO